MSKPLNPDLHKQTILEFDDVTFSDNDVYDSSVSQISFTLESRDLAIVLLEKEHVRLPLADLAAGADSQRNFACHPGHPSGCTRPHPAAPRFP